MARNKRSDKSKDRRKSAFVRMQESLKRDWIAFRSTTDGETKLLIRKSMDRAEDALRSTGLHLGLSRPYVDAIIKMIGNEMSDTPQVPSDHREEDLVQDMVELLPSVSLETDDSPTGKMAPTLRESKHYALARTYHFFEGLKPSVEKQMIIAQAIEEHHPRALLVAPDVDPVRIFLTYTNKDKRNFQMLIQSVHPQDDPGSILDRSVDFDHFMAGYHTDAGTNQNLVGEDVEEQFIEQTLLAATKFAAIAALGLSDDNIKTLGENILLSICAIVYNDPLDVFIHLMEAPAGEDGEANATLRAMFCVQSR